MSSARLRRTRRSSATAGSRVKTYDFGPGRLERLTLTVWSVPSAEGLRRAKLEGQAYVACDAGKVHRPEIEIEIGSHPSNTDPATLIMIAAAKGDETAATELAEELAGYALEDWFDPCSAEGLDEEEER